MICNLCPRHCFAERNNLTGNGFCGSGVLPAVALAVPFQGEEPCITGNRGSGAVFFCGCSLQCFYCQNYKVVQNPALHTRLTYDELSNVFLRLQEKRVHNINLITGTHYTPVIAKALLYCRTYLHIPVIWNSSGYESLETIKMLDGLVDIYLPDYKYADASLAAYCSSASDYPQIALAAIQQMRKQSGKSIFSSDGMMLKGTMVRHMVLPGFTGASLTALNRLHDTLPSDVQISLMSQYTPVKSSLRPPFNRQISAAAYRTVVSHCKALGLHGYTQSINSAGTSMIPEWDEVGISDN